MSELLGYGAYRYHQPGPRELPALPGEGLLDTYFRTRYEEARKEAAAKRVAEAQPSRWEQLKGWVGLGPKPKSKEVFVQLSNIKVPLAQLMPTKDQLLVLTPDGKIVLEGNKYLTPERLKELIEEEVKVKKEVEKSI